MTIQHFLRNFQHAALLAALVVPIPLTAQQQEQRRAADHFPHYVVEDLGTLGGHYSFAYNLNNAGVVSGGSATATQTGDPSQAVVNAEQTAFVSDHGRRHILGTLGGPDSAAAATNLFGLTVIDSETRSPSRQGEDVCGYGKHLQCLAAIFKGRRLSLLSPLPGGNDSYALDMNDRGQVAGFSDTDVYDTGCAAATTAGFQFQAVIWEPNGTIRQLAPLDRENGVAFAFGINNRGQTVGGSGLCGNTTPPPYPSASHAVLWDRVGTPIDLGSFGGPVSIASAINEHGDISGTSLTPDGLPQAFLWTPETRKLIKLQTPPGFASAVNPCCKTINDRREIVGLMFGSDGPHAFLWKDGVMVDLNDLIPQNSPWLLQSAAGINDSGQIAGQGMINGEVHAFLATPCHRHEGRGECCEDHDHDR